MSAPAKNAGWIAYGCLALSMTLVGTYVGLSPMLVAVFPVTLLAWMRFAVAAVAMSTWVAPGPTDEPLSRRDHGLLLLQSFLGNFLFTLCALKGAAWAGGLASGVIMAGIPAAVALLSMAFLGERLSGRAVAAVVCSCAAVALVALGRASGDAPPTESAPSDRHTLAGYGLLVAAVFCEASYVVIGKRLSGHVSPRRVTAIINLWGLAFSTPLALPLAFSFTFGEVSPSTWGLFLFYALSASVVTVWLWMRGLAGVQAQQAGIFTVMLPISAAAVGILVLGESVRPVHVAALVLALLAIVLATRAPVASIPAR